MISASAPGKLILCGEHAVVYGHPAIAVPLAQVRATVTLIPGAPASGLVFVAPDLAIEWSAAAAPDHPLCQLARAVQAELATGPLDLRITFSSTIPVASGLGSGAAVATALVRALATYAGHDLPAERVSALVYSSEQLFHGTPSGIDNTVTAYERPVWFQRADPAPLIEPISIGAPLLLLIGDTGVRCETRLPVGAVRRNWQADPATYERHFGAVAAVVHEIRTALATGDLPALGRLLNANQALLAQIGVSSPELERLIAVALAAGARGAKLSGGGWGGVMFALVDEMTRPAVAQALHHAGAARVLTTPVLPQDVVD